MVRAFSALHSLLKGAFRFAPILFSKRRRPWSNLEFCGISLGPLARNLIISATFCAFDYVSYLLEDSSSVESAQIAGMQPLNTTLQKHLHSEGTRNIVVITLEEAGILATAYVFISFDKFRMPLLRHRGAYKKNGYWFASVSTSLLGTSSLVI